MLKRQQKKTLINIAKFVLPIVSVFLILSTFLTVYTVKSLTHPARTKYAADLSQYDLIGKPISPIKKDQNWSLKDGGQASGWLLQSATGAPVIILSHSYNQNMVDLLSLAVALHDAGYHVLMYDLRGQGQSSVEVSSLGDYESDDLVAAIENLKTLKDGEGNPLIDKDRIGLYGVSVGAYASLVAAGKSPSVKAVVVDAAYPDVPTYLQIKIKDFSGLDIGLLNSLTGLGMKIKFSDAYNTTSAQKAIASYVDVKQLFIFGKDAGELLDATKALYEQAHQPKISTEVPHSRLNILYKTDQDVYDPVVVDFFRQPDVLPLQVALPTPPVGTPTTPGATPAPVATPAATPAATPTPAKK